jgi:hypothetical protein
LKGFSFEHNAATVSGCGQAQPLLITFTLPSDSDQGALAHYQCALLHITFIIATNTIIPCTLHDPTLARSGDHAVLLIVFILYFIYLRDQQHLGDTALVFPQSTTFHHDQRTIVEPRVVEF